MTQYQLRQYELGYKESKKEGIFVQHSASAFYPDYNVNTVIVRVSKSVYKTIEEFIEDTNSTLLSKNELDETLKDFYLVITLTNDNLKLIYNEEEARCETVETIISKKEDESVNTTENAIIVANIVEEKADIEIEDPVIEKEYLTKDYLEDFKLISVLQKNGFDTTKSIHREVYEIINTLTIPKNTIAVSLFCFQIAGFLEEEVIKVEIMEYLTNIYNKTYFENLWNIANTYVEIGQLEDCRKEDRKSVLLETYRKIGEGKEE